MDTDLVVRAQGGDRGAFTEIADVMLDRYLAVAHRILRDGSLAEDATQAALLGIWRDLPKLRDPTRFGAWSMRLLVNACYSEARRAHHPGVRATATGPPSKELTPRGAYRCAAWTPCIKLDLSRHRRQHRPRLRYGCC